MKCGKMMKMCDEDWSTHENGQNSDPISTSLTEENEKLKVAVIILATFSMAVTFCMVVNSF